MANGNATIENTPAVQVSTDQIIRDVHRDLERHFRSAEPRHFSTDTTVRGRECILCNHSKEGTRLNDRDVERPAPDDLPLFRAHVGPGERDYHICKSCVEVNGTSPLSPDLYRKALRSVAMEGPQSRVAHLRDFERLAENLLDELGKSTPTGAPTQEARNAARRIAAAQIAEKARNIPNSPHEFATDRQIAFAREKRISGVTAETTFEDAYRRLGEWAATAKLPERTNEILTHRFDARLHHAQLAIAVEVGENSWASLAEKTDRDWNAYAAHYRASDAARSVGSSIEDLAATLRHHGYDEADLREMAGDLHYGDDDPTDGASLLTDRVLTTNDLVNLSEVDNEASLQPLRDLAEVEHLGLTDGTVKWWDTERGIGIVTAQGGPHAGEDFFLHESGVHGYGIKDLTPRSTDLPLQVTFEAVRTEDGQLAAESLAITSPDLRTADLGSSWVSRPNEAIGSPLHQEAIEITRQREIDAKVAYRQVYEHSRSIENPEVRQRIQDRILADWNRNPADVGNRLSPDNPLAGFQVRPRVPRVSIFIDGASFDLNPEGRIRFGEEPVFHSGMDESAADLGAMRFHISDTNRFVAEWVESQVAAINRNTDLTPAERTERISEIKQFADLPDINPEPLGMIEMVGDEVPRIESTFSEAFDGYLNSSSVEILPDFGTDEYKIEALSSDVLRISASDGRSIGNINLADDPNSFAVTDREYPEHSHLALSEIASGVDPNNIPPSFAATALPPSANRSIDQGVSEMLSAGDRYLVYTTTQDEVASVQAELATSEDLANSLRGAKRETVQTARMFTENLDRAFKDPATVRSALTESSQEERRQIFEAFRTDPIIAAAERGWEVADSSRIHAFRAYGARYNEAQEQLSSTVNRAKEVFSLPSEMTPKEMHEHLSNRVSDLKAQEHSLRTRLQGLRTSHTKFAREWNALSRPERETLAKQRPDIAMAGESASKRLTTPQLEAHL